MAPVYHTWGPKVQADSDRAQYGAQNRYVLSPDLAKYLLRKPYPHASDLVLAQIGLQIINNR